MQHMHSSLQALYTQEVARGSAVADAQSDVQQQCVSRVEVVERANSMRHTADGRVM